jgi:hypothetical protein
LGEGLKGEGFRKKRCPRPSNPPILPNQNEETARFNFGRPWRRCCSCSPLPSHPHFSGQCQHFRITRPRQWSAAWCGTATTQDMNDDPIKRYTLLVLFQAQQDHATELTITSESRAPSGIRYKVDDVWYDMSPPPAHILPEVIAELGRLAAFSRRPFPKEGIIDEPFQGVRLHWVIRMDNPDAGCVLTPIDP